MNGFQRAPERRYGGSLTGRLIYNNKIFKKK
jgi:hypothetical protein